MSGRPAGGWRASTGAGPVWIWPDETGPAATRDSEYSMSKRPVAASGASRTERISVSNLPRSVTVRTKYITASTRPHARLQPRAAMNIARMCASLDSATETAPTKVRAMNRPKSISDTRSTGLNTGSRAFLTMLSSPIIAIDLRQETSFRYSHPSRYSDRRSSGTQHGTGHRQDESTRDKQSGTAARHARVALRHRR